MKAGDGPQNQLSSPGDGSRRPPRHMALDLMSRDRRCRAGLWGLESGLMPKQDMPMVGDACGAVRELAPRKDMSSVGRDADAARARYSDEHVDHSDGSGVVGGGA
jgi:hypothetical protein